MTVTRVFQKGETIQIDATSKDQNGNLVNPSAGIVVTVTNPSGVAKVNEEDMNPITTGLYRYFYRSTIDDETGWWRAIGKSTDGAGDTALITITEGGFELK